MNGLRFITLVLVTVLVSFSSASQSRPYAKFNSRGEIIGLFDLSEKRSDCRDRRSMTGSARSLWFDEHENDITVYFTFDSGGSRRIVVFKMGRDAIPRADIESLLAGKKTTRVTACLNSGKWIAEEITKKEK